MKSLYRILLPLSIGACLMFISADALAWGSRGHDITCCIAERHLSKKAQKEIAEIFDGKSIVYWSSWMDNASHQKEMAYTKTWHYMNIDADETYENAKVNENGDVLTAIETQVAALKSGTLNKEAKALALKMVIHFVGDLHCPMHMGHRSDSGGNGVQVRLFNNGRNLHSVWDSGIIESAHSWTYSEWADQLDRVSKAQYKAITSGTPREWGKETYIIASKIYEETPAGTKLSYDEVNYWAPTVEDQLLKGGLRLAAILNEIFK